MRSADRRADLALAALLAVTSLIMAPGLAIVALVAILVLVGCGVTVLAERRLRRRRPVASRPRAGQGPAPRRRPR